MLLKYSFKSRTKSCLRRLTLKQSEVIFDEIKFSYELVLFCLFCLLSFNLFKGNFTTLVIG